MTETMWALSMITKAGVATKDIRVGVASYGRSVEMSTEGCYESWCTWDAAGAAGSCTNTAGYISNAELDVIPDSDSTATPYSTDDTDILVYNETQWVGYMNATTRANRTNYYKTYNFGGLSEWAIDLETNPGSLDDSWETSITASPSTSTQSTTTTTTTTVTIGPTVWAESSPVVTCSPPCLMIMPPKPLTTTTTITFTEWDTNITWSSTATKTTTLNDGSVVTYKSMHTSAIPTRLYPSPVTTDCIDVWNQAITPGPSVVHQTSSVRPTPLTVTYTQTVGGSTTVSGGTTSTIAGVSYSFGNFTYASPPWTGVFGGTTIVANGTWNHSLSHHDHRDRTPIRRTRVPPTQC
ncbi:glycoside hydrolase family 18 protein [Aspergillus aculeatus ATCC 16872]|uniref:Glycoside hydrolase family 18 protein n=1 Tax=Aspergillus aculeatus (strain ATCC 16872 / CBS 172.66 / WB 5094) TaxID=690307 RepID=A0A1L9WZ81_ASPA1|nr:glycoside hydrolase family 18 protein [Aspergillus aculeatus ATCC 16872]OJK01501.1 glycoside hydrolase family 18 protein [Aspergillus aculeatus ATCC 16872]